MNIYRPPLLLQLHLLVLSLPNQAKERFNDSCRSSHIHYAFSGSVAKYDFFGCSSQTAICKMFNYSGPHLSLPAAVASKGGLRLQHSPLSAFRRPAAWKLNCLRVAFGNNKFVGIIVNHKKLCPESHARAMTVVSTYNRFLLVYIIWNPDQKRHNQPRVSRIRNRVSVKEPFRTQPPPIVSS